MKRTHLLGAMLGGTLLLWSVYASGQQKPPQKIEEDEQKPEGRAALRVEVEQVQVDVTVQDKKGNLIGGLKKGNFKVYENKLEQEIVSFSPTQAPMTAVFVAEYSKAIPWEFLYEVWMASHIFVDTMRPGDWVAVIAYDIRPEILVDFTQDKGEVVRALSRLNYPAFSESNLYDTVIDTLDRLEEVDGKTAMILVSSGLDTFSKKNLNDLLRRVKKTNVVIYPVSIGGNFLARYEHRLSSSTRMDFYQAEATLKAMAKQTGGEAYFPRFQQAFPGVFQTISALLRSQYSLSYVSTNTARDGKFRKIKVKVWADVDGNGKPDKLKVRHKQGYIVEKGIG
ncbi:MAG: VWA domain-containing protein [Acidobacteriota bacterium]